MSFNVTEKVLGVPALVGGDCEETGLEKIVQFDPRKRRLFRFHKTPPLPSGASNGRFAGIQSIGAVRRNGNRQRIGTGGIPINIDSPANEHKCLNKKKIGLQHGLAGVCGVV